MAVGRKRIIKLSVGLLFLALGVALLFANKNIVSAFSVGGAVVNNYSPWPWNSEYAGGDGNGDTINDGAWIHSHFIRKDGNLGTYVLQLHGYINPADAAGRYFQINKKNYCKNEIGSGGTFVRVTVQWYNGPANTYWVRKDHACDAKHYYAPVYGWVTQPAINGERACKNKQAEVAGSGDGLANFKWLRRNAATAPHWRCEWDAWAISGWQQRQSTDLNNIPNIAPVPAQCNDQPVHGSGGACGNGLFARYPLPDLGTYKPYDPGGTGYYRATITVEYTHEANGDGTKAAVSVNGNIPYIGQPGGTVKKYGYSMIGRYANDSDPGSNSMSLGRNNTYFNVPFGFACNEPLPMMPSPPYPPNTPAPAKVYLFDADNSSPVLDRKVKLRIFNRNTRTYVPLIKSSTGGPNYRYSDSDGNGTLDMYTPTSDEDKASWVEFTPQTNNGMPHKYEVVVTGLDTKEVANAVSVGMPGDSIYGVWTCPNIEVGPYANKPAGFIEVGQTFRLDGGLRNYGNQTASASGSYRAWFDNNGNRAYDAGDTLLEPPTSGTRSIAAGASAELDNTTAVAVASARYACVEVYGVAAVQDPITRISTRVRATTTGPQCTPIAKAPSFAVAAGGVRVGGNYSASSGLGGCSVTKPGTVAAASMQYYFGVRAHSYSGASPYHTYVRDSVLSLGEIENVASNRMVAGGTGDNTLHFARGPGAAATGVGLFYGDANLLPAASPIATHCLSDVFAANRYPSAAATNVPANAVVTLPDSVAGTTAVTYNVCGNVANNTLTLNGPNAGDLQVAPGEQYVVRITQTGANCNANPVYVKLAADIRYIGNNITTTSQLPQFVFLAGTDATSRVNILVDNSVTRLDGIYANRGISNSSAMFLTCAQRVNPAAPSSLINIDKDTCANSLRVNGAVILGGRLQPYRTYGHGTAGNTDPAETFNLRPDVILGDSSRGGSGVQLDITSQREVAPRF